MTKEVMKQALEALEINLVFLRNVKPFKGQEDLASDCVAMTEEIISTLEEALKQEQNDSVSYIKEVIEALYENSDPVSVEAAELLERINAKQGQGEPETLNYTVSVECKRCGSHEKYDLEVDYPPPQPRKPLTDEQIVVIVREASHGSAIRREGSTSIRIARAIEFAHGIKE